MSEQVILVGVPVGAPGYTPGPDYQQLPCDGCRAAMWLGPLQWGRRGSAAARLCFGCALARLGPKALERTLLLDPHAGSRFDRREAERVWRQRRGGMA